MDRDYFVTEYLATDVGEREHAALRREAHALVQSSSFVLQSSFRDVEVDLYPFPSYVPPEPGLATIRVVVRDLGLQIVFRGPDERLALSVAEQTRAQISAQILALNYVAKARQAKREWEASADLLDDEIYLFDTDLRVHRLNRKAAGSLGGEPQALVGLGFPAEIIGGEAVLRAALPTGPDDQRQFIVAYGAGYFTVRVFYVQWAPSRAGYILIRSECTADVQGQRAQLQGARLVGLGQVSMGLAHEINNPLGVILAAAGSLQRRFGGQAQVQEYVSIIIDEVERCRRITHALLEYGRKPQRPAQAVSLNRILAALPDRLAALHSACRVEVEADAEAYLVANEDDLLRLFTNLVTNAYEAAPHAPVRVRLAVTQGPSRVEVVDAGAPVPPEIAARMFDPFVTTKKRGTGLGLAFAQKIAEQLGGRVYYEHRGGNVFTVELPVQVMQ